MDDACSSSRWPRGAFLVAAGIVAVAAAARVVAGLGELWFDEIWSWAIASGSESFLEILTGARHDNNHILNTWILYLAGPDRHPFVYRLPAMLAGVGSVILAGMIPRRRTESILAMLLVGFSYFCIHYASEARGYAYAVFFALVAFYLLQRSHAARSFAGAAAFGTAAILGLLSQLTFVYAYGALLAWSVARHRGHRSRWLHLAWYHTGPILFGAALYVSSVRDMKAGGGSGGSAGASLLQALSLTVGGPIQGWIAVVAASLLVAGVAVATLLLFKHRPTEAIPYVGPIVLSVPAALLAGREDFYPRLFLVATVFLLLLCARGLARLLDGGHVGRIVVAFLLVAYLGANAVHYHRLIRVGRSSYREAIALMARMTPGSQIIVGSMHDFRTSWILRFNADAADPADLYYYPRGAWPRQGPDWQIRHDYAADPNPETSVTDDGGNVYRLAGTFAHAGLSGWNWHVYRNERAVLGSPAGAAPELFRIPRRTERPLPEATSGDP